MRRFRSILFANRWELSRLPRSNAPRPSRSTLGVPPSFVVLAHCAVRSGTTKRLQELLGDSHSQVSVCRAILRESGINRKLFRVKKPGGKFWLAKSWVVRLAVKSLVNSLVRFPPYESGASARFFKVGPSVRHEIPSTSTCCNKSGSREYRRDPDFPRQSPTLRLRAAYGRNAWCGSSQNAL